MCMGLTSEPNGLFTGMEVVGSGGWYGYSDNLLGGGFEEGGKGVGCVKGTCWSFVCNVLEG